MKKRQAIAAGGLAAVLLLGAAGTALAAGTDREPGPSDQPTASELMREGGWARGQRDCAIAPKATLTEAQTATLLRMREEEQLAHDLYQAFAEKWGGPVFRRVAASEARHIKAMERLLDRYGLTDPSPGPGFADKELQAMWDEYLAKGLTSREAALEVGRAVETADIADLEQQIAAGQPKDVAWVYQHLLKASKRHLVAFGG